jgi:Cytochrome c554 and c-prime
VEISSRSLASLVLPVYMGMLTLGWAASGERKPEPQGGQPAQNKVVRTPQVTGSLYCSNCHTNPSKVAGEQLICRMTEYPVWSDKDRHAIAYDVLLKPRGREIVDRLKIDLAAADNACVRCHGISIPQGVVPFQFDAKRDGVTCVACHGAFQEWILEHQIANSEKWRALTRAQKEEQKGMRDLWDPKIRVETCLSCHVGSPSERKILTHEMYAAGHPPLPSIEVATFSDQQPRHWQIMDEKDQTIKDHLGFKEGRLEQTELVAIGSLVALKTNLALLTTLPTGDAKPQPFLDFARFDCTACHHNLVQSDLSWRQARRSDHAPGRPLPPVWSQALVRAGLEAADPARADDWFKELQGKLARFEAAMTERPFGNIEKAGPIASGISRWLEEPLKSLNQKAQHKPGAAGEIVGQGTALRMLRAMAKHAGNTTPDYESARQMAWAFGTIYVEWSRKSNQPNKEIKDALNRLDQRLMLTLGPGLTGTRTPIVDSLDHRLKAAGEYNPDEFLKDFQKLLENLPKIQPAPPPQPAGGK